MPKGGKMNLDKMSIDDLLTHVVLSIGLAISNGDTTDDKALPYKTEIRERVAKLENRLKNVSKECEVCPDKKDLRQQVINLENKNLKRCGNCGCFDGKNVWCELRNFETYSHKFCPNWKSDNLTKEERIKR
jgi:hypothetical protein